MYLIVIGDNEMAGVSRGSDAADAVDLFYDSLDAYCEPGKDTKEDFSVMVLAIPADLEKEVEETIDDLGDDAVPVVEELVEGRPEVGWEIVNVEMRGAERRSRLRRPETPA